MGLLGVRGRVERHDLGLEGLEAHAGGEGVGLDQPFRVRDQAGGHAGHRGGAVDEGEALLVAELHGLDAGALERRRPGHDLALVLGAPLPGADQRDAGQRPEVAAGAERAFLGHAGQDTAIVHRDVFLQILQGDRRSAAAEGIDARQHGGADVGVVEMGADVGLNAAQDVVLHLLGHRGRHQPVHEAADAGGDAVNDPARGDELVEQFARGDDALADLGRDLEPDIRISGGGAERVDGEVGAVRAERSGPGFGRGRGECLAGQAGVVCEHDRPRGCVVSMDRRQSMPAGLKNAFFFIDSEANIGRDNR